MIDWLSPAARMLLGESAPARTSVVEGQARVLVLLSPVMISERHALTPAELHVIECLAAGNSTLEIAGILALSEATVRTHLRNIYRKLRVCSRTEAVLEWQARAHSKVA
jgi:DNA-binding CsgD family transcriptional regulator